MSIYPHVLILLWSCSLLASRPTSSSKTRSSAKKGFMAQAAAAVVMVSSSSPSSSSIQDTSLKDASNQQIKIDYFRSQEFKQASENSPMASFWLHRLFSIMTEPRNSVELKCAGVLEYYMMIIPNYWYYCRQVALIMDAFRMGTCPKSSIGSYRVELLVVLFDRILDIHNFEFILMVLNAEEHAAVFARIGICY